MDKVSKTRSKPETKNFFEQLSNDSKSHNFIEQAPVITATFKGSLYVVETINNFALEVWAKNYDTVINKPLFKSSPELEYSIKTILDTVFKTGEPYQCKELKVELKRNGKPDIAYFNSVYMPLRDDKNKIYGIGLIGTEVTDTVVNRNQSIKNDLFNQAILEANPDCVKIINRDGEILFINQNGLCQLEIDNFTTLKNKNWFDIFGNENRSIATESLKKASLGEIVKFTISSVTSKGTLKWWDVILSPVTTNQENVQQLLSISRDVTSSKIADLKIKESKDFFETTIHNVPSGVYHLNNKGKILYVNLLGAQQMGYDSVQAVLNENDVYKFRENIEKVFNLFNESGQPLGADESCSSITLKTGKPAEVLVQFVNKKSGKSFWLLNKSVPSFGADGKLISVFSSCTDITNQRKSELELTKIASHFKLATDAANVGTWSLNVQNQQLDWSDLHKIMWGYDANRTDLTYNDWHSIILEKDKVAAFQKVEEARINKSDYEVEYRIKRPNDNVIRWIKSFGQYYYNDFGEAITLTGVSLDITEQKSFTKELEKKVKERTKELDIKTKQLQQINNKLDKNIIELENANINLKSFSYLASHDLQEPLRIINMFIQRISQIENFSDKTLTYFNYITDATIRMRNLINSLFDFSRLDKTDLKFVQCDLNSILNDSKRDLQISIAENEAIIEDDNLPTIYGNEIQLTQVFINIISNAIKYSKQLQQPHIKISSNKINGSEILNPLVNKNSDYFKIEFKDNGIGFEEEFSDRIFEAFQRLHGKNEYAGTGIGLSIVKKIIENHNGFVTVKSKVGVGSTFTIYLPVVSKNALYSNNKKKENM